MPWLSGGVNSAALILSSCEYLNQNISVKRDLRTAVNYRIVQLLLLGVSMIAALSKSMH